MRTAELGASLLQALAAVPDPRAARGRRHPLAAILTLAVAAMLADARSLYAIAQWGRLQSAETVRALGFTRAQTPTVSTLHEVFKMLDVEAFEAALIMHPEERRRRMRKMRQAVEENNIYRWAGKLLSALVDIEFPESAVERPLAIGVAV